jgi:plastocyanin domain-containing protein
MTPDVILKRLMIVTAALVSACDKAPPPAGGPGSAATAGNRVAITVNAQGYQPPSVTVAAGRPVTLVFTRTSDEGCGTQVMFPALNIRRDLPLNQPVEVTLTPTAGTVSFTCGMNMFRGALVAQ